MLLITYYLRPVSWVNIIAQATITPSKQHRHQYHWQWLPRSKHVWGHPEGTYTTYIILGCPCRYHRGARLTSTGHNQQPHTLSMDYSSNTVFPLFIPCGYLLCKFELFHFPAWMYALPNISLSIWCPGFECDLSLRAQLSILWMISYLARTRRLNLGILIISHFLLFSAGQLN